MEDEKIKLKINEFFEMARILFEENKWNMDMQNVVDDLATISSCCESPEAVQKKIDELKELSNRKEK
jgi:hypothetical protein